MSEYPRQTRRKCNRCQFTVRHEFGQTECRVVDSDVSIHEPCKASLQDIVETVRELCRVTGISSAEVCEALADEEVAP